MKVADVNAAFKGRDDRARMRAIEAIARREINLDDLDVTPHQRRVIVSRVRSMTRGKVKLDPAAVAGTTAAKAKPRNRSSVDGYTSTEETQAELARFRKTLPAVESELHICPPDCKIDHDKKQREALQKEMAKAHTPKDWEAEQARRLAEGNRRIEEKVEQYAKERAARKKLFAERAKEREKEAAKKAKVRRRRS